MISTLNASTFRRRLLPMLLAVAAASLGRHLPAATVVINANNPAPGDDFTNASTTNTTPATPGALLGSTGWTYNNVRNNGHVGVNTNLPQNGNGSVWFNGTQGPVVDSSKADIEFYNVVAGNLTAMGTLGNVDTLAYDWYKSSGSAATQHASLRLLVDGDGNLATTNDRGALVYERAYQADPSVPTDQWVSDNLISANLWQTWFGNGNFDTAGNFQPLSVWGSPSGFTPSGGGLHLDANSVIYGLSSGIGSGWDTYVGAVDDITLGFTGFASTTSNFEVVVPEPSSIALATFGLVGLAARGWRRKR